MGRGGRLLVLESVGLSAYIFVATRARALADRAAAAIDVDAGLGGELRSASWFASREERDDWADLHLERAAARLNGIDWASCIPVARRGPAPLSRGDRRRPGPDLRSCRSVHPRAARPARRHRQR